jgi:hypothetical protein
VIGLRLLQHYIFQYHVPAQVSVSHLQAQHVVSWRNVSQSAF